MCPPAYSLYTKLSFPSAGFSFLVKHAGPVQFVSGSIIMFEPQS